jgi:hypothetical protein
MNTWLASALVLYSGFFQSIEGRWDGAGKRVETDFDGTTRTRTFRLQSEMRDNHDGRWTYSRELAVTDAGGGIGTPSENHDETGFEIRGSEGLFVSDYSIVDPVQVIDATEHALAYRIPKHDVLSNRRYVFEYRLETDARGRTLTGSINVFLLDQKITDESYSATRR